MNTKKRLFLTASILIILVMAILFFYPYLSNTPQVRDPEPPLLEAGPGPMPEPIPEPNLEPVIMERFSELYAENNDLVGWIKVPNTKIDYPVVYCEDSIFYLKHGFNKEPHPDGTPFLSMEGDILTKNRSLSLWGHHRTNGTMFSDLHQFKQLSFYKENPVFSFDTIYQEGEYKIFSAFYMSGSDDDAYFYYFPISEFADDQAFTDHLEELVKRSIFNTTVEVGPDDQIVILSCCTYETGNLRFSIAGRKIRPEESQAVDVENARLNPEPLYPEKWYQAKGGQPPDFSQK